MVLSSKSSFTTDYINLCSGAKLCKGLILKTIGNRKGDSFFQYFAQYLFFHSGQLFFHPGCSGMCCFTWATVRSQQLLFVVLAAGLWCFTAGCHVKSPLFPQPLSNRSVLHNGRKHKTVVSSQPNGLREEAQRTSLPLIAIGCQADCSGERRTSPFNGIEKWLSRAVVINTTSLPVSATTFPTALSLYIAHDGRKRKHNPTLSANKHVVQICRSSLSAATLKTVQVSVKPRLSTALKDRLVKSYSSPKDSARLRCMYHVSNSVVFLHRAGTLAKGYPLSKLFSKAEPVPFRGQQCNDTHTNDFLLFSPGT